MDTSAGFGSEWFRESCGLLGLKQVSSRLAVRGWKAVAAVKRAGRLPNWAPQQPTAIQERSLERNFLNSLN
jgi:uncharacterized protein YbjT (DUF2867 family)